MNAVEIEEAVSSLAMAPFDAEAFPFQFLEAFGNKPTTVKRLQSGSSNKSDIGGVLQTNNIHIKPCLHGSVSETLSQLKQSPATSKARAKFILATDGSWLEAEDLRSGETIACDYPDFADHFGFFLPLAGISTVKQVRESAFDIKATGRLNKLYIELLRSNPEWGGADRRHEMNHFLARLIFCFFAEDTSIFDGEDLFTSTIEQMSDRDSSNTHKVIGEIFRAMNTKSADPAERGFRPRADRFPYVNGGLFSGSTDVPVFTKIARSYLLHIGSLDWKKINPDIFGSMIQAVADDDERGALGMHYTSVPNILKVLNPLFLDELREKLQEAGDNSRKLLNLRNRMSKIRVFDPACGSGNFLVIAYKEMRAIEAVINERRGEAELRSVIPLTNFRGIELRDFPAEIARLALIIAEYQCDVLYRGQQDALRDFLPLESMNWITCGNALHTDWLSVCPPTGEAVQLQGDDLFSAPLDQAEIDFENQGGETYICGNPPYVGSTWQSKDQKGELEALLAHRTSSWRSLDYVACWLIKAVDFGERTPTSIAFVSTKSVCQGQQVPILWPLIFGKGFRISFAHTSFKWANLASHNAGVTVVIVGLSQNVGSTKKIYSPDAQQETICNEVPSINAYLVAGPTIIVEPESRPKCGQAIMVWGNKPTDGGNLLLDASDLEAMQLSSLQKQKFIRRFFGSAEYIRGNYRYCIWIDEDSVEEAQSIKCIKARIDGVRQMRLASQAASTRQYAEWPYKFRQIQGVAKTHSIIIPAVSSERRPYLPVGILARDAIIYAKAFAIYDAPLWNMALIASRLHWVWVGTVCVRMRTDFSYSNTLGWNTFPIPALTEKNKRDLTRCAEDILLAREAHFPSTIADLYDPEKMPSALRAAHDRNDEVLERIYIGRRFRNDTERLEKLFDLYKGMFEDEQKKRVSKKEKS
ncbi:class I SAM-dependent DNA methyltransferase [Congregibacter litoralis]|uniref:site-specific DNA-methyltransferase (adenine-specific) n=1 Tax=Congregibacter litoralis KT71 TaxID=314285 RepID=A4A3A2_9GAMM|nr:DNA methyltransferase [Congregibacter litoralis]EAQ99175.2 Methyltransferase domain protein [Congregibacter litoralis KT71]